MDTRKVEELLRSSRTAKTKRGWRCVEEGWIAAYVDGALPATEKEHLESHLAVCDHCLRQVSSILRIVTLETPNVPLELLSQAAKISDSRPANAVPTWQWAGLPAVAVLFLFAILYFGLPTRVHEALAPREVGVTDTADPAGNQVRDFSRTPVLPAVLEPRDGQVLTEEALRFRWREVQGTLYYELNLVDAMGSLVWESRSQSTEAKPPSDLDFNPDEMYFFWVRAYLEEGKTVKSPAVSFAVSARR